MIIGYDRNPDLTIDQKLNSLIESIQLALNEKADAADVKAVEVAIDKLQKSDVGSTIDTDLDKSGLTYLWSKIKAYVQQRHVELTQAEYDALTTAEKTNGTVYFITDASPVPSSLFNYFYPVGSYYETSDASFDPNSAWGGTWVLETEGQVHIGAGSNYTIGDTGGEETHTLTINEMPSHAHNSISQAHDAQTPGGMHYALTSPVNGLAERLTDYQGGGQSHNNMQPYIVVNRWHRTA